MKTIINCLLFVCLFSCQTKAQPSVNDNKINITSFNVYEKDNKIFINWATDGTASVNYWEVQRSTNGTEFSTIAMVLGPDPRQQGDNYQYMEKVKDSKVTVVYYRLCHIDTNGKEIFSEIKQLTK